MTRTISTLPASNQHTHLHTWRISGGEVSLYKQPCGQLTATRTQNGRVTTISNDCIKGIPTHNPKQIEGIVHFLKDSYMALRTHIGENQSDKQGYSLDINLRVKGGMFSAIGGALSAVSSIVGYFTVNNYRSLAAEVIEGAQETIEIGGRTTQATLRTAESSATKVTKSITNGVNASIDNARHTGQLLMRETAETTQRVITAAGTETRQTVEITELQVEKAMTHATKKANLLMRRANLETQKAIKFSSDEAKSVCLAVSDDVKRNITHTKEQTSALIKESGETVSGILDTARREAIAAIRAGGEEYQVRSLAIINAGIQRAQESMNATLEKVNTISQGLVTQISTEARGVILDFGKQGQLLIKDTGEEIRITADAILSKAFEGQQMIIRTAGEEARLTIQTANKELRTTLYELPSVAGQIAEQVGRNFVVGAITAWRGITDKDDLLNKIRNTATKPGPVDIKSLVNFVMDLRLDNPADKVDLYKEIVRVIRNPEFSKTLSTQLFLFLAIAIYEDKDLDGATRTGRFSITSTPLRQQIISAFQNQIGKDLLNEGQPALDRYMLEAVPTTSRITIEEVDPLEEMEQNHQLLLAEKEQDRDEALFAARILEAEKALLAVSVARIEQRLTETHAQQEARIRTLERSNASLLQELQFHAGDPGALPPI